MGKQYKEQQQQKKVPKKKLIKRQVTIDTVDGQRQYNIKPLMEFQQYLQLKSKRYNKYRKQVTHSIVIDKFQVKSAVDSLKKFEQSHQTTDLFENQGFIYLQIVMGTVPEEYSIRPVQIPLPVPIYSEAFNTRSAIFVTDPQRSYKDKIQDLAIPTVAKVIGYEKLKKNYKMLKDKRSLLYSFDLFFCDWRIYNLLRKPAGKLFYERKKYPFPIDCEGVPAWKKQQFGEDYAAYLNDLNNYTYFMIGNGPVQQYYKLMQYSQGGSCIHGSTRSCQKRDSRCLQYSASSYVEDSWMRVCQTNIHQDIKEPVITDLQSTHNRGNIVIQGLILHIPLMQRIFLETGIHRILSDCTVLNRIVPVGIQQRVAIQMQFGGFDQDNTKGRNGAVFLKKRVEKNGKLMLRRSGDDRRNYHERNHQTHQKQLLNCFVKKLQTMQVRLL